MSCVESESRRTSTYSRVQYLMLSSHIFLPLDHVLHWVGVQEDVNIQSCSVFDVIQPHISPIGSCPALSRSPGGRQQTVVFSIWCYPTTYFSHWIMSCVESESRRTSTDRCVQYLMLSSHIFPPLDHVLRWIGVQEDVNREMCSVFDVIQPHISPIGSCPALNRSPGGRQQTDVFGIWCYPPTSVLPFIVFHYVVPRRCCYVWVRVHTPMTSFSSFFAALIVRILSCRWWSTTRVFALCSLYEIFKIPLNHYMYVSAFRVQLSQSYINIANVRLLHSLYLVDVEVLFVFHSSFTCATSAIANPTLARICS